MGKKKIILFLLILAWITMCGGIDTQAKCVVQKSKFTKSCNYVEKQIRRNKKTIDLTKYKLSRKQFLDVLNIAYDQLNYSYRYTIKYSCSGRSQKVLIVKVSKKKQKEMDKKFNASVKKAMSVVKPRMTDYEKVKAIHDWLLKNTVYPTTNLTKKIYHTSYGAIVNKKAVCEGYANAFNYLCTKAGVKSTFVWTDDHIWNMVRLNGKWYHVDVTNDDNDKKALWSNDYFLVNDKEMEKSYERWNSFSKMSSKTSYYNENVKLNASKLLSGNVLVTIKNNNKTMVGILKCDYVIKNSNGKIISSGQLTNFGVLANNNAYNVIENCPGVDISKSTLKVSEVYVNPYNMYNGTDKMDICGYWDSSSLGAILTNTLNKKQYVDYSLFFYDKSGHIIDAVHYVNEIYAYQEKNIMMNQPYDYVNQNTLDYNNCKIKWSSVYT